MIIFFIYLIMIFKHPKICYNFSSEIIIFNVAMKEMPQKNHRPHSNPLVRYVYLGMGFIFLGLGLLGTVVPGLPTTVFILLAGYCWAKSSEKFYNKLMKHRVFGKMIQDWEERRAMPRFAKYLAWTMMALSSLLLFYTLPPEKIWISILTTTVCLATAIWMYKLPDA